MIAKGLLDDWSVIDVSFPMRTVKQILVFVISVVRNPISLEGLLPMICMAGNPIRSRRFTPYDVYGRKPF